MVVKGKNITYRDISIRGYQGDYICSAMVNGRLVEINYVFYTRKEALTRFYRHCNAL